MVIELDVRPFSVQLALWSLSKKGRPEQFYSVRNVYEEVGRQRNMGDLRDINEVDNLLNRMGKKKGLFIIQRTNPSGYSGYRFDGESYHKRIERDAVEIAELMKQFHESQILTPEMLNLPITI